MPSLRKFLDKVDLLKEIVTGSPLMEVSQQDCDGCEYSIEDLIENLHCSPLRILELLYIVRRLQKISSQ